MSSLSRGVRHEPLENGFLSTRESNGKQHTEKKRYKVELEKELSAGNEPTRSLHHTM